MWFIYEFEFSGLVSHTNIEINGHSRIVTNKWLPSIIS